jgi:hypothetical protein
MHAGKEAELGWVEETGKGTQAVKEGQVKAAGPWRHLCKISQAKTRSNT